MKRKTWVAALAVLLITLMCHISLAAEPVSLADTSWILQGKTVGSSKLTGRITVQGGLSADFDSFGQVHIEDDLGYGLSGTYAIDAKGKLDINIAGQEIEDFILDNLEGYASYVENLAVISVNTNARATQKAGIGRLFISIRFVVTFQVYDSWDDKYVNIRLSYKISAKGVRSFQTDIAEGAEWFVDLDTTFKTKGLRDIDSSQCRIVLGPSSAYGLDYYEFEIYQINNSTESILLAGHYYRQRNKFTFVPYTYSIDQYMEDIAWDIAGSVPDIYDLDTGVKVSTLTASIKGQTMKLRGKVSFFADVETYDDNSGEYDYFFARGTYSIKGTGSPAP